MCCLLNIEVFARYIFLKTSFILLLVSTLSNLVSNVGVGILTKRPRLVYAGGGIHNDNQLQEIHPLFSCQPWTVGGLRWTEWKLSGPQLITDLLGCNSSLQFGFLLACNIHSDVTDDWKELYSWLSDQSLLIGQILKCCSNIHSDVTDDGESVVLVTKEVQNLKIPHWSGKYWNMVGWKPLDIFDWI